MHYHAKAPGGGFHATGRTQEEAARLLDQLCGMEPAGIEECDCGNGEAARPDDAPASLSREDIARFVHRTWSHCGTPESEDYAVADGILRALQRETARVA